MSKVKMTFSLSEDLATYLRSKPNSSTFIAEAVSEYRERELEQILEEAYREDAEQSEELNRVWEGVDAEVEE